MNYPRHVSMERQFELVNLWMAKSNDIFVCMNCVELLHELNFDEANKTGRKDQIARTGSVRSLGARRRIRTMGN